MNNTLIDTTSAAFSSKIIPPAEARRALEGMGFVNAQGIGWVPRSVYEKTIARNLFVIDKNGYHSFAKNEVEVEEIVGYRGRTPITQKKKISNVKAISDFFKEKEDAEFLLRNSSNSSFPVEREQ